MSSVKRAARKFGSFGQTKETLIGKPIFDVAGAPMHTTNGSAVSIFARNQGDANEFAGPILNHKVE